MKRVVVTGLGVVSPIGNTVEDFWNSIVANKHGFELAHWFEGQSEDMNVVARVKNFDCTAYIDKKTSRRTDMITQYAVYASMKALEDADAYGIVLRAKGYVANAEGEKWIHFDYVPGEPDIRDGGAMVTGRICVIGSKLNEEAVAKLFGVEKQ